MEGCFSSCKYKTAALKFGQQWPKEMLIQCQVGGNYLTFSHSAITFG